MAFSAESQTCQLKGTLPLRQAAWNSTWSSVLSLTWSTRRKGLSKLKATGVLSGEANDSGTGSDIRFFLLRQTHGVGKRNISDTRLTQASIYYRIEKTAHIKI